MNSTSEGDLFSEGLILVDLLASFIATNGVNIATGFSIAQNLFKSKVVSIETHSEFILFSSEDAIFSFLTSNSYPRGDYVSRLRYLSAKLSACDAVRGNISNINCFPLMAQQQAHE